MAQFEEPETLAVFDRSWNGLREQLRLELSEYKGNPVYTLRLYWQNDAGEWRWAAARPSSAGRYWASLTLKAKELHLLGTALVAEAAELEHNRASRHSRKPSAKEQAALDEFTREHPPMREDPDIPF